MDLREFLRALRHSWAVILVVFALFVIVGSAYTLMQKPRYEATAQAYVAVGANDSVNDLNQGAQFAQSIVKSFANLATNAYVLQPVSKDPDVDSSLAQLRQQVTAEAPVDSSIISVTAEAGTPEQAAVIANAVTARLSTAVEQLNPTSRRSDAGIRLTPTDPATAPPTPASPNTPLNIGVAAILGLLVGLGLAILRQRLDTRIRDVDGAREVVTVPVLGQILEDPKAGSRPLVAAAGDDSRRSEAFRSLRTNLEFLDYDRGTQSMVVTSSLPQEGKSVTAANLAVVLAEAGKRVALVDADLRRPRLGTLFGLEDRLGLTDVLIGATRLDHALQPWGSTSGGLAVLPAGRVPPNPSELLQSNAMEDVIDELEELFDVVLIDTPPVVPVSDAAILTRRTSGALLIAAAGRTRRPDLRRAAENLRQVDGTVLGLVLTMVPSKRSALYGYERLTRPALDLDEARTDRPKPALGES